MRPHVKVEEPEEIPFPSAEADSEEEKIWVNPRVPTEMVLCREGLVVFQLLDWRGEAMKSNL